MSTITIFHIWCDFITSGLDQVPNNHDSKAQALTSGMGTVAIAQRADAIMRLATVLLCFASVADSHCDLLRSDS
ncbi:MAG: hypothetical protein KME46_13385 [Brasilonema angustatum HA4187-MV1]|nr:hypothetical protein [Brasilonema angustatum HA4187-MV1]